MEKELKTLNQARKVLNLLPNLKDRVICFIPQWETHKLNSYPSESPEKDFTAFQSQLFSKARKLLLENGSFSFIVTKELNDDYNECLIKKDAQGVLDVLIEPKHKKHFDLSFELEQIEDNFLHIYPRNQNTNKYISAKKPLSIYGIEILCIDYSIMTETVLFNFLLYAENFLKEKNKPRHDDMEEMHELFNYVSPDVKLSSLHKIEELIEKEATGMLTISDIDELEFLATNHMQNITLPFFWNNVEKLGYLCGSNYEKVDNSKKDIGDFRFFYSFEALLFWELLQCLKNTRRCKNCNNPLPIEKNGKRYKGLYCTQESSDFEICNKERDRKRQLKFKKNLNDDF